MVDTAKGGSATARQRPEQDLRARVALLGDVMLGRLVGERLTAGGGRGLVAPELVELLADADLVVANLECCISARGERFADPAKSFFFRAPPAAAEFLATLGVDCVSLANNHSLDYGATALADTLAHLGAAGVATVGAGGDLAAARAPAHFSIRGLDLAVIGATDHPAAYAAGPATPGVAHADLLAGTPRWLLDAAGAADPVTGATLLSLHWGPNMVPHPVPHVRGAAGELVRAGASLVAGHSAHCFHGVAGRVLFDLGDFLDDYAVDPERRNDLGLVALVTLGPAGPDRVEAVPIRLEHCATRLATPEEHALIARRFAAACAGLGTAVHEEAGRLVVATASGAHR